MNDWIKRHLLLTKEERWLIAAILLIALTGLGAKWYLNTNAGNPVVLEQK